MLICASQTKGIFDKVVSMAGSPLGCGQYLGHRAWHWRVYRLWVCLECGRISSEDSDGDNHTQATIAKIAGLRDAHGMCSPTCLDTLDHLKHRGNSRYRHRTVYMTCEVIFRRERVLNGIGWTTKIENPFRRVESTKPRS